MTSERAEILSRDDRSPNPQHLIDRETLEKRSGGAKVSVLSEALEHLSENQVSQA